jgi:hypothetical protein
MADNKELPSVEYSLKSISWHLKVMVEEVKKLNKILEDSRLAVVNKDDLPF